MKCFSRMLVAAALMTAMAGTVAAQSTSGVLNTLEVQRLVTVDTAAAHLTLSNHYMALAERFAADAARYDAFASASSAIRITRSWSGRTHVAYGRRKRRWCCLKARVRWRPTINSSRWG